MGGPDSVSLPASVTPGMTIDISVNLIAPEAPGKHQSYWMFQAPNGARFGVGPASDKPIWVKIRAVVTLIGNGTATPVVSSIAPPPTFAQGLPSTPTLAIAYDFVGNACAARWESNTGLLSCPGVDGDTSGFVIPMANARLEDGTTIQVPTLLTFPQYSGNGFIQGTYPEYQVQVGDHFQTTSSCQYAAPSCSVLFQLSYLDASGSKADLWTFGEFYDGKYFHLDLDLSKLAGERIRFILRIYTLGSPVDDRALWVAPQLVHFPVTPVPPSPTGTPRRGSPTPAPSSTPTPISRTGATPTPTPGPGNQGAVPSLSQIIQNILNFLNHLLGN
jgi:Ig-like domain from next to BRCA1 gene